MTNEDKTKDHGAPDKTTTIVVNGRPRQVTGKEITYEEVVALADNLPPIGPNTIITVTYNRGHGDKPQGTLVAGTSVRVKEKMIFNVTATDKS